MTAQLNHVVVVGASLAGLRAAETLRQQHFEGRVTVVGAETHRPYDRPPLSKKLLSGEWEPDRIHLRQPDIFDDLDVEWRLGVAASRVDLDAHRLDLADGTSIDFDGLIIATGAAPRRLPGQAEFDHVHVLRSLDDSLGLRSALAGGGHQVVVIGAGFIGLEVASVAKQLGNDVTVLEGGSAPLIRGLGAEMGNVIADIHRTHGIDVRCNVTIDALTADGVRLADGDVVPADVVLVGIGVEPATGWLEDSGLDLDNGIVCDSTLRAASGIYAAGDVARWHNDLFDEQMRVEHWTNAAEQGAIAAKNLLIELAATDAGADTAAGTDADAAGGVDRDAGADAGADADGAADGVADTGLATEAYAAVPFFWSDQFDLRIQFLGRSDPDDQMVLAAGSAAEGKLLALYGRNGKLHGAFGLNAPRWVMPMRKQLLAQVSLDEAIEFAATLT